jgi:hypothetical protein
MYRLFSHKISCFANANARLFVPFSLNALSGLYNLCQTNENTFKISILINEKNVFCLKLC